MRQTRNLHQPICNSTQFQKGILNVTVKIYNNLPHNIKESSGNSKEFKIHVKKFLYSKSSYTLLEYFNQN
jgi:hypothetical protein